MKEIGGYFELELSNKKEYHDNALNLNSGRNAFKYILKAQNIIKVYLPYFICNSVIEPLDELNISYEFYNLDEIFEIKHKLNIKNNEKLFYINYYALKSEYIHELVSMYGNKLIVDNTQAFFEKPIEQIDTIYSPRKFFGVSDGGYLFTNCFIKEPIESDYSTDYSRQLLGRLDSNATSYYENYQKAEQRLIKQPIKKMSHLTQTILSSIDYDNVIRQRRENFEFLHNHLEKFNLFEIESDFERVPFVYPFKTKNMKLKNILISNKIYVAKYWEEVLIRDGITVVEEEFVNNIIPLPIDQRYTEVDMEKIVTIIKGNV